MFANLREDIEYRLEILGEDCLYYADRLKKPLMLGAFISVLLTLRAGRQGISFTKGGLAKFSDFSLFGGGSKSYSSYGDTFGSYSSSSSTQDTASLMDAYEGSVKAARGGVFFDYGSTKMFEGEIVTIKSVESASPVEEALAEHGKYRILKHSLRNNL